ncbi:alpha/beta fold hydrolase [Pseudonocardia sp. TRM90224]|uniref:alpha/beta fold hydrolase n=1 Tax=Pseudonocardia sp. TRM90224 TaxID=2812678 RepID=UPI001E2C2293|nr:alpha/beta hydrolase [Pseudonocardia sp. TRM90224]
MTISAARTNPGTAVAADGTRIAYQRIGEGPPVVVLPGALNHGEAWRDVAEQLAAEYTFLLVDRRFYPPSGAGPTPSSFTAETADVRAMIEAAGEPVHLFGHSYGGLLALHAALADPSGIRSLLLYEPPVLAGGPHVAPVLQRFREQLDGGNPLGALMIFLTEIVKVDPAELGNMIGDDGPPPTTEEVAGFVDPLLHDIESLSGMPTDPTHWSPIELPVLLMAGGRSWGSVQASTAAIRAALPGAEVVTWPEQTHFANMLVPDEVAATLREYLRKH